MTENKDQESLQDITKISKMIQEMGYKAQIIDEDSISTAMSGFAVILFYFPGHSVQMYTGFKPLVGVFEIEEANSFNTENRFSRCYVTESGIRFEGDYFFDLNDPDADETLKVIFRSWEITLGFISEALSAAKKAAEEGARGKAESNEQSATETGGN